MKKILVTLAVVLSLGSASYGANNAWQQCGIGAMVFPDNGNFAALSNIIWDLGTTAITSKISSAGTCAGSEMQTALFINETYPSIEAETVKGEGAHLTAMLDIVGCDVSARDAIMTDVRAEFADSLQDSSYSAKTNTQKAEVYFNIVDDAVTGKYASSCEVL